MKRFILLILIISIAASCSAQDIRTIIKESTFVESEILEDNYFITGKISKSFSPSYKQTDEEKESIRNEAKNIDSMRGMIDQYGSDINSLSEGVTDFEKKIYAGLATVTALTSLHPNPRTEGPIELSVGMGVFRDQCAGAAGLFIHPTKWSMVQGGVALGSHGNFSGYVGITISLFRFKKK